MDLFSWGFLGLFCGSFLSATLLPLPSEGLLLGFFELEYPIWICVTIATLGNTLGAVTNYLIGRYACSQKALNRFKLNDQKINRWQVKSQKWGHYLGLLAWVPFVGDPMVVALGFLKVKFLPLLCMMFVGKLIRYVILALLFFAII